MTLEEFRQIKQEMIKNINRLNEIEETIPIGNYSISDERNMVKNQYNELLSKLLKSNLSNIPFEEWKNLSLIVDDELDFSKTHANIDFSLLDQLFYFSINLKNCNVKGIETIEYDDDTFDEEFIKNHPNYFPDENLPSIIREKYFDKQITFSDLKEYPLLRKSLNSYCFNKGYNDNSASLVNSIGLESALKMFDENPEFIIFITQVEHFAIDFDSNAIHENKSYEEKKYFVYNTVNEAIKNGDIVCYDRNIFPKEMIQAFPKTFISEDELPEEIIENFYLGMLNIDDILVHRNVLENKEINIGIRHQSYDIVETCFGSIWNFFDVVPKELHHIVINFLEINRYDDKLKSLKYEDIIKHAIDDASSYDIVNNLDTVVACCKYLPIHEVVLSFHLCEFIKKCGLKNLQNYNKKNNNILDLTTYKGHDSFTFLYLLSTYSHEFEDYSINSEEDLHNLFNKIFYKIRYDAMTLSIHNQILTKFKDNFAKVFPNHFIDFNEVNELLNKYDPEYRVQIFKKLNEGFNSDLEELLEIINKQPNLINALKGKEILISNSDYYRRYRVMIDKLGMDKFLQIGILYGCVLPKFIRDLVEYDFNLLLEELSNGRYEVINDEIYNQITSKRTYDIRLLPKSFKDSYPELFLPENAPKSLSDDFYGHGHRITGEMIMIGPYDLQHNHEWIPYLMHIDLNKCLRKKIIYAYDSKVGYEEGDHISLYSLLEQKFSNEEILNMLCDYGRIISEMQDLDIDLSLDKEECYKAILRQIYEEITTKHGVKHTQFMPDEFKNKYPELFLDDNAPDDLKRHFYSKTISFNLLYSHPEWKNFLIDKSLSTVCDLNSIEFVRTAKSINLSNEEILDLFIKYGDYLDTCDVQLSYNIVGKVEEYINNRIIEKILNENVSYEDSLKNIIGDKHPELFLDDNAPDDLKYYFYNIKNNSLTFELLRKNKEWLPFLKDKNVLLSLKKSEVGIDGLELLFQEYGTDEALKIGMKNPDTVMRMLEDNKFYLLSVWYDRLNFIPHHVVMTEFPESQKDKFISSGKKWSQLMRIEGHNLNEESKSALLKASFCFGVFDNDSDGFNKIMQLFTDIPRTLTREEMSNLKILLIYSNHIDDESRKLIIESYELMQDGNYVLKIDPQKNKKVVNQIRKAMDSIGFYKVLSPEKAHQLFGGFTMKYDPSFRDFIINNIEEILTSSDYISYISSIQKQWTEIKAFNRNRTLTLDLALAYVKSNDYIGVEVGNEKLAAVSNQTGYSQDDFDVLQQIYNYGKTRIFNSIPNLKGKEGDYTYEMLRLDDPLALVVGTLTDCCQEIGNHAEMCVEHSTVSKHGRIFVIKDKEGAVVAQSWVWRNKNVICFDNIEIPDKQMINNGIPRGQEDHGIRNEFTDQVLNIYIKAANELIEEDNKKYSELLKQGKITEEQYESLKLKKVTTGEGYSNVKGSFVLVKEDTSKKLTRPLAFEPPIQLDRALYVGDSADTQYILAGDKDVVDSKEETLALYSDKFIIFDKDNIKSEDVLLLQKLELTTKGCLYDNMIEFDEESNDVISDIADNYDLNSETTKIIMNPNFAIIYEENKDSIIIADIFYNDEISIDNEELKVIMQIRLALDQLGSNNKKIETKRLDDCALEIFNKAINLDKELDIERGISHGTK